MNSKTSRAAPGKSAETMRIPASPTSQEYVDWLVASIQEKLVYAQNSVTVHVTSQEYVNFLVAKYLAQTELAAS